MAIPLGQSGVAVEQRSAFHLLWLMAAEINILAGALVSANSKITACCMFGVWCDNNLIWLMAAKINILAAGERQQQKHCLLYGRCPV